MKRFSIIALAAICIVALGAGQVFADSFKVTSGFGLRVTEQGVSERVGSITIAPSELGTDLFRVATPQVITIELLGGATISRSFGADYLYNAGVAQNQQQIFDPEALPLPAIIGDYRVIAVEGDDFVTIIINADSVGAETVVINHAEPDGVDNSALCFNLQGTIYNSVDPAQQLVQVSYNDNVGGTFSGDIYVATVKPKSVIIDVCGKAPADLQLLYADQDETCGFGNTGLACMTMQDVGTGAFPGGQIYEVTIGRTDGAKVGVGFGGVAVYWYATPANFDATAAPGTAADAGPAATLPVEVERVNRSGDTLDPADYTFPDDQDEYFSDTAQYTFQFTAQGPGLYVLYFSAGYDTCIATPGPWVVDLAATRVPCGGSFSASNFTLANWVTPIANTQIFPYCVADAYGWFNGLVITNPGANPITVSFAITEADGDVYTGSTTVAGNQMAVGYAQDVMNPTTTGADAAFGDESYTVTATSSGLFYSFLFIGDGTMAQGYKPWGF